MSAALLQDIMQKFQALGTKFLFVNALNFHLFSGHLTKKQKTCMIIIYIYYIFTRIIIGSTIPGSLLASGN